MDLKKTNVLLTILFSLLFSSVFTYGSNQENPLMVAIQLFDEGKYPESEPILKKLLDEKPEHLMVNYYYGACRTENGHYGTNEIKEITSHHRNCSSSADYCAGHRKKTGLVRK